jgi:hypothetical protein
MENCKLRLSYRQSIKQWLIKKLKKYPVLWMCERLLENLKIGKDSSIIFIGSTNSNFISHQPLSYHIFIKNRMILIITYQNIENFYLIEIKKINNKLINGSFDWKKLRNIAPSYKLTGFHELSEF